MHAFDHGAILRSHQTAGLRAGDAQCVHRLLGIEREPACGGGSG